MRKIFICLFICTRSSTGFAAALSGSIAIELQEHGKFTGVIGKAYITEQAVEVLTFAEQKKLSLRVHVCNLNPLI